MSDQQLKLHHFPVHHKLWKTTASSKEMEWKCIFLNQCTAHTPLPNKENEQPLPHQNSWASLVTNRGSAKAASPWFNFKVNLSISRGLVDWLVFTPYKPSVPIGSILPFCPVSFLIKIFWKQNTYKHLCSHWFTLYYSVLASFLVALVASLSNIWMKPSTLRVPTFLSLHSIA